MKEEEVQRLSAHRGKATRRMDREKAQRKDREVFLAHIDQAVVVHLM